jgi:CRP/FNR family transcriptional regulator, cyclic AMP receptor protein
MSNTQASVESLRSVAWLEGLPDEALQSLAAAGRFKRYASRQEVVSLGDVERDCFFLVSGSLGVTAWSPGGRQVSYRQLQAGEIFGEYAALDGLPRSATVLALSDSVVLRLSPETLQALLKDHWTLCLRMLVHLAGSARQMTERVYELSAMSVRQRLCAELLRLASRDPNQADQGHICPLPSHTDLAARIASVRPQVTRELAELERAGALQRSERDWLIPSLSRLTSMTQDTPDNA